MVSSLESLVTCMHVIKVKTHAIQAAKDKRIQVQQAFKSNVKWYIVVLNFSKVNRNYEKRRIERVPMIGIVLKAVAILMLLLLLIGCWLQFGLTSSNSRVYIYILYMNNWHISTEKSRGQAHLLRL